MIPESTAGSQLEVRFSAVWAGQSQLFCVASVQSAADAAQAACESYRQIAAMLSRHHLRIAHERIFGALSAAPLILAVRERTLQIYGVDACSLVTYIQGHSPWGGGLSGVIVQAVSGEQVQTVEDGGVACGRRWRTENASDFIVLQNIQGHGPSSAAQARVMIERAERILKRSGFSYRNVARTWFYLSGILDWYDSFNRVRSEKYHDFGIMPGPRGSCVPLPSSTGISADTPEGSACAMDLIAAAGPADAPPLIKPISNTGQIDAFRYGSAFSRGAIIQDADAKILQVSGTAAIDEHGESLFVGDARGQIECTLDKIESLMAQAGAGLRDIVAATVFVKHASNAKIFLESAARRGLAEFPGVCVVADVCREELLFEMDAEAAV
jgi:enamine deaminase RidA (YjgF/YER057c/UK114 family)